MKARDDANGVDGKPWAQLRWELGHGSLSLVTNDLTLSLT